MRRTDPEKLQTFWRAKDGGQSTHAAGKLAGVSDPTAYAWAKKPRPAGPSAATISAFDAPQANSDDGPPFTPMEPKKFQMLMLGEQRWLKTFAASLTRNSADTDDLLSRANIRLLESRERFRPGTNFKAWSTTVIRNMFMDDRRTAARRPTVSIDDQPEDGDHGTHVEALPQFQVPPNQENGIIVREMKRAVLALPDDQRAALIESEVNGKQYDQIAAESGVEEGTIKSRVSRARTALDRMMPDVGVRPQVTKLPPVAEPVDPYDFVLARLYADREAIDVAIAAIKKARRMAST